MFASSLSSLILLCVLCCGVVVCSVRSVLPFRLAYFSLFFVCILRYFFVVWRKCAITRGLIICHCPRTRLALLLNRTTCKETTPYTLWLNFNSKRNGILWIPGGHHNHHHTALPSGTKTTGTNTPAVTHTHTRVSHRASQSTLSTILI